MGRTVYFTGRDLGLPDDVLEVRCDFLQFEHTIRTDRLEADEDTARSKDAKAATLCNVAPADLDRLRSFPHRPSWETIAWDDEDGHRVERNLKEAHSDGQNVRCAFW